MTLNSTKPYCTPVAPILRFTLADDSCFVVFSADDSGTLQDITLTDHSLDVDIQLRCDVDFFLSHIQGPKAIELSLWFFRMTFALALSVVSVCVCFLALN